MEERRRSLPFDPSFDHEEDYVSSILHFVTNSQLFQTICGGVHILDFLTREPDLYSAILPQDWRLWFDSVSVPDILDLLLHEDLRLFSPSSSPVKSWRGGAIPPHGLLQYVRDVRRHTLVRDFKSLHVETRGLNLSYKVALGMNIKKKMEVESFSQYVEKLTRDLEDMHGHEITHIMDFGAGQNYLGRALASPPFGRRVVALESKTHNVAGAKSLDNKAGLGPRERIMRNKKEYREALAVKASPPMVSKGQQLVVSNGTQFGEDDRASDHRNNIQYLQTIIESGNLSGPIDQMRRKNQNPSFLVIGLHACGNLTHHGIRSLILNSCVKAVCLVGCCYNLLTERTGPPTFKFPSLRYHNIRLEKASSAFDPHGFPMSKRMTNVPGPCGEGVNLNITARSMACQAPQNWTSDDCHSFFTRHFYRSLLQRILLDHGILRIPRTEDDGLLGATGQPVIIGSLRKPVYASFISYVRGATAKLRKFATLDEEHIELLETLSDDEILDYEARYANKKKELSIVWSLMSFSAGVAESAILVDRWLFLKEQSIVKDCWVETVFEPKKSPRNFCVVGIKR